MTMSILTTILQVILTLLAVCFLVCFHELGHFLVGRWLGAKPYSFSVGFGPKLFERRMKAGWTFYIRLFPVGGYVSFDDPEVVRQAVNDAKEINAAIRSERLQKKTEKGQKRVHIKDLLDTELDKLSPLQRFCVYFAGPGFNVILAFILSFAAYAALGTGVNVPVVKSVVENGQSYGILQKGDVVLSLNGVEIQEGDTMRYVLQEQMEELGVESGVSDGYVSEKSVTFLVERDGETVECSVHPKWDAGEEAWKVGIQQDREVHHLDVFSYAQAAVKDVQWELGGIYEGLVAVLSQQADSEDITGIVGAVGQVQEYANPQGAVVFLMLMSLFSANLAVINLLPIPGLDGSKALLTVVEGMTKKRLPVRVELALTAFCMFGLMVLTLILCVRDVANLII